MKQILIIILLFSFISGTSFAEVYKWVDDEGVVYFTDDTTQISEKYRPQAERIELTGETEETKVEGELVSKMKEETLKDRLGRGETYWRGLVEEWIKRIMELQDQLGVLRSKYNELTEKFNSSKSTAERGSLRTKREQVKNEMDQCKNQIEEAKIMIEKKIPEEAEFYEANSEWVKP
jgi:hypothetical protein